MDWRKRKTVVLAMVERDGKVIAKVVPDQTRASLKPKILENIELGSELHTDELRSYQKTFTPQQYGRKTVNHGKGEYVAEDGTTTNQVENFFRHLKNSILGTHISVSSKHLESYVKEFEYRFNRRTNPEVMLGELLSRFPELDT